jgi:hypothetical protein
MQLNLSSRFQQFTFSAEEQELAKQVSPLFYALLQNKIAEKANAAIDFQYGLAKDQLCAIIEHESLKAQVFALEELMAELTPPTELS